MAMATLSPPLRLRGLLGYGSGNLVLAAYFLVSSSLMLYATAILGLPAWFVGALLAASMLWDALTDVPMGWLSDITRSQRFGRRHGYLVLGALAVAASSIWLWGLQAADSLWLTALQLGLAVFAVKTALTVYVVPYNALADELGHDERERSLLHAWRAVFQVVAILTVSLASNLVFFRASAAFPRGQLNPAAYPPMGWALAGLVLAAALLSIWSTRRARQVQPLQRRPALLSQVREIWRDHNARMLFSTIFCIEATFQIGIVLGSHIYTYSYQVGASLIALFGLAVLVPAAAGQFFWAGIGRRYSKKTALFWAAGMALTGSILGTMLHIGSGLFSLAPASLPYTLTPFLMIQGFGVGAFWSLPYSMIGECARATVRPGDPAPEASWMGFYAFGYKLGGSVSLVLAGVLLGLIGFDGAVLEQSATTRYWLAVAPALLLLSIAPLAAWLLAKYRSPERAAAPPSTSTERRHAR